MSENRMKELEQLARPLIKWLNDNYDPHHKIIIEPTRVDLLSGEMGIPVLDYLKD